MMGKKKYYIESNNSDETTESCDEIVSCPHITKSTSINVLKRVIEDNGILKGCKDCLQNSLPNGLQPSSEFEVDDSLWICIKCGNQGCGRTANEHALMHSKANTDSHSLCINTTLTCIWCYDCDNQININTSKKLREICDFLSIRTESHKKNKRTKAMSSQDICSIAQTNLSLKMKACGLRNLGNTCFFNSVLQCLGQTPYLRELLEETSTPGQYFILPGGRLTFDDGSSSIVEPLDGNLESWRPLPKVLAETLHVLQNGSKVYSPNALLSKLIQRMPQFGGGDQHDSHELLRHLLEAVREEDLRRYQTIILDKLGKRQWI